MDGKGIAELGLDMWLVAMTRYGDESKAERSLNQIGFDTYNPKTWRYIKGKPTREPISLFPTYIFIQLEPGIDSVHPIKHSPGVLKLVQFGDAPAIIPQKEIDKLIEMENLDGVHLDPQAEYAVGDTIRITDKRMGLYQAIITAKPRDRLRVLLSGMGKDLSMVLKYDQVEPA